MPRRPSGWVLFAQSFFYFLTGPFLSARRADVAVRVGSPAIARSPRGESMRIKLGRPFPLTNELELRMDIWSSARSLLRASWSPERPRCQKNKEWTGKKKEIYCPRAKGSDIAIIQTVQGAHACQTRESPANERVSIARSAVTKDGPRPLTLPSPQPPQSTPPLSV